MQCSGYIFLQFSNAVSKHENCSFHRVFKFNLYRFLMHFCMFLHAFILASKCDFTSLQTHSVHLVLCILQRYRKSSKETRGCYFFFEGPNAGLIRIWPKFGHFCLMFFKSSAGLIRMRVLFEGGSLSRIYGICLILVQCGMDAKIFWKKLFLFNLCKTE